MKLAPHAVVVPPRFYAYGEASEQVFAIFERYTPLVEPLSLDEAFLDVTASVGLFGAPAEIARRIRKEIATELSLPASAGIAAVKFVAKIASDLAKPNGQREVRADETVTFLAPLPVSRCGAWAARPRRSSRASGSTRSATSRRSDVAWLEERLGSQGRHLWELARGHDPREVVPDRDAKSVGAEDTFEEDLTGLELLRPHVHAQALRVGRRLRKAGVRGRVVQLKIKFADFSVITRRTTLSCPDRRRPGALPGRARAAGACAPGQTRPAHRGVGAVPRRGRSAAARALLHARRRAARSSTLRWTASPSASAPRRSPRRISRRAAPQWMRTSAGAGTDLVLVDPTPAYCPVPIHPFPASLFDPQCGEQPLAIPDMRM